MNGVWGLAWLGCYTIAVLALIFRRMRRHSVRLNFYITDIWAAMLGLAPSLLMFVVALRKTDLDDQAFLLVSATGCAVFQCLGIVIARLFSRPRAGEVMPRRLDQVFVILMGAWVISIIPFAGYVLSLLILLELRGIPLPLAFLCVLGIAVIGYAGRHRIGGRTAAESKDGE